MGWKESDGRKERTREDGLRQLLNFSIEKVEMFKRNYPNFDLTTKKKKHRLNLKQQGKISVREANYSQGMRSSKEDR